MLLPGCALILGTGPASETRYLAREPIAHEAGPIYEGPMVHSGLLKDSEVAIMEDDVAFDPWGSEDIRVGGIIDDDLGLQDGVVN